MRHVRRQGSSCPMRSSWGSLVLLVVLCVRAWAWPCHLRPPILSIHRRPRRKQPPGATLRRTADPAPPPAIPRRPPRPPSRSSPARRADADRDRSADLRHSHPRAVEQQHLPADGLRHVLGRHPPGRRVERRCRRVARRGTADPRAQARRLQDRALGRAVRNARRLRDRDRRRPIPSPTSSSSSMPTRSSSAARARVVGELPHGVEIAGIRLSLNGGGTILFNQIRNAVGTTSGTTSQLGLFGNFGLVIDKGVALHRRQRRGQARPARSDDRLGDADARSLQRERPLLVQDRATTFIGPYVRASMRTRHLPRLRLPRARRAGGTDP